MEFETQYDEFGGKSSAPHGSEEYLMWCARWARGVLMAMEECRMKFRGANPAQGVLTGIKECISSRAAHPC
jgi:hypothetical protein